MKTAFGCVIGILVLGLGIAVYVTSIVQCYRQGGILWLIIIPGIGQIIWLGVKIAQAGFFNLYVYLCLALIVVTTIMERMDLNSTKDKTTS